VKHRAIFKGMIERKTYYFDHSYCYKTYNLNKNRDKKLYYEYDILPSCQFVKTVEFLEKEIDNPPIEIGEKVYIPELNLKIKVTDRVRNLDGGYIYSTNHVVDTLDDERTMQSKDEAKKQREEFLAYIKEKESKENKEVKLSKKWYQFWK